MNFPTKQRSEKISTSLDLFDKTLQTTNIWLNDICSETGCNRDDAWKALTTVLHRLRNRLPVGLAVNLGAQLPILIRGVYYDQFEPAKQPTECDSVDDFVGKVGEWLGNQPIDPRAATKAVFETLTRHVSSGVIGNVVHALPEDVRQLWPEDARRAAENKEQPAGQTPRGHSGGKAAGQPQDGAFFGNDQESDIEPASAMAQQRMTAGTDGAGPAR